MNQHRDPDMFDVRASLRTLVDAIMQRKRLIAITTLLTVALVTVYVVVWPPVYAAKALIMAERDSDFSRDAFYVSWNIFRKDDARTDIELMTSGPILKEVIERENLKYEDVYHPFLSHAAWIWEKSAVGQRYRAVKRWMFPPDAGAGAPSARDVEIARIAADMREGISIDPVGESNVGLVTVKAPTRRAADMANTLLEVYLTRRTDRHHEEAMRSYKILSEQVDRAGVALKEVEQRRLAYTNAHGLAFDFKKESEQVTKLTELEANVINGTMRIAALEATLRDIDAQLAIEPPTRTASTVFELNALREHAKSKRMELQMGLLQLQDRYRPDSPEVTEVKRDLEKLDVLIGTSSEKVEKASTETLNAVQQDLLQRRSGIRSELQAARASVAVMQANAAKLNARFARVPEMEMRLKALDRELGAAGEIYSALVGKKAQAEVSVSTVKAATPTIRIVENAAPPAKKYWPKTKLLYPSAVLVGLLLGASLAVAMSYLDGTVRREHIDSGRVEIPLYSSITVRGNATPISLVSSRAVNARNHE